MIAYRKVKLLEHILNNGFSNPSKMKIVDVQRDDSALGIVTTYDRALDTIGFSKYLSEIFGLKIGKHWTLHEAYVKMMSDFIGEDLLNNHERSLLYKIETKELQMALDKSSRYQKDLKYYNSRTVETKLQRQELAYVLKGINHVIQSSNSSSMDNPEQGNLVARFENNRKDVKIRHHDARMLEIFNKVPNLPYAGHIHPNLFWKMSKYIPQFSSLKKTLFQVMAEDEPSAEFCEVIMLMLIESKLLGCENIVEFLEPIVDFGTIHTTMISVAYLLPELPKRPEQIVVAYRYDEDLQLITDRTYLKDVLGLRGLGLNGDGVVIIKKDNMTAWDAMFKGAYKPKNGNYNDIREINLTK